MHTPATITGLPILLAFDVSNAAIAGGIGVSSGFFDTCGSAGGVQSLTGLKLIFRNWGAGDEPLEPWGRSQDSMDVVRCKDIMVLGECKQHAKKSFKREYTRSRAELSLHGAEFV